MKYFVIFFFGFIGLESSIVYANDVVPEKVSQNFFLTGECELSNEIGSESKNIFCIKANGGVQTYFNFGSSSRNFWLRYGRAYVGFHSGDWFSLHLSDLAVVAQSYKSEALQFPEEIEAASLIVRFGNPLIHKWNLNLGSLRLPFGIGDGEIVEAERIQDNLSFWPSTAYSAYISYDDQVSQIIQFGVSVQEGLTSDVIGFASLRQTGNSKLQQIALRYIFDLGALDGSRFVFSILNAAAKSRSYGAAYIVAGTNNDKIYFEFVRKVLFEKASWFEQLLKTSYISAWRNDARWIIEIEDEFKTQRSCVLQYDQKITNFLTLKNALSFKRKSERSEGYNWSFVSGMEAQL